MNPSKDTVDQSMASTEITATSNSGAVAETSEIHYNEKIMDSDGDVKLLVGEAKDGPYYSLQVSSVVLRLVSKVFKALLRPQFLEGKELEEKGIVEVPLPDDDPEAMVALCSLFHHRTDSKAAKQCSEDELYQVAILVDKYDCYEAVSIWLELCCLKSPILSKHFETNFADIEATVSSLSKWVFVLHVLKNETQKNELLRQLLKQFTLKDKGFMILPSNLYHILLNRHESIISTALDALNVIIASRRSLCKISSRLPQDLNGGQAASVVTWDGLSEVKNVLVYGTLVLGIGNHLCMNLHDLAWKDTILSLVGGLQTLQNTVWNLTNTYSHAAAKEYSDYRDQRKLSSDFCIGDIFAPILNGMKESLEANIDLGYAASMGK